MHVCMHVCMYVCVYLCMYVRTYVCMYTLKYTCIPQCIVFLIQGARSINKHQKNSKYRQRIWIKKLKSSLRHTPVITFKTSLDSNRLDDFNAHWQRASLTTNRIIIESPPSSSSSWWNLKILKTENHETSWKTWNVKIEKSWIAKHDDHFAWNMIIVVMVILVILVIMLACHCSMAHCWSRAGTFQFQVGFRMGREVYADFLIKNLGIAWKSGMPCLFQRDSDVLCHLSLFEDWDSYTRLSPGQRKRWKQCSRKIHRPKSSLNSGLRSEHSRARDIAFQSIIMLNPKIPKLKTHEIRECDWEEHGRTLIFESESQPLQRKLRVCTSLFLDCQHPTSSMQTFGMLTALIPMDCRLPHEIDPPLNFLPGISHDPWDWS